MNWTNRIQKYFPAQSNSTQSKQDPCKVQDLGLGFPLKLVASSQKPLGTTLMVRLLMHRDLEQAAEMISRYSQKTTAAGLRELLSQPGVSGRIVLDTRTQQPLGCLIYQTMPNGIVILQMVFQDPYSMAKAGKPLLKSLAYANQDQPQLTVTTVQWKSRRRSLVQLLAGLGFQVEIIPVQPTGEAMYFLKSSIAQIAAL